MRQKIRDVKSKYYHALFFFRAGYLTNLAMPLPMALLLIKPKSLNHFNESLALLNDCCHQGGGCF